MHRHTQLLSPAAPDVGMSVRQSIIDFWRDLSASGDAGCASWDVLEPLQDRVTECLACGRLREAADNTAKALCLIQGLTE